MELLIAVVRKLRTEYHFYGFIHLRTIPNASHELISQAGEWADRISINVELATQRSLNRFAPDKNIDNIKGAMASVCEQIEATQD